MSATVEQIKDDALTLIGQVAGPASQAYDDIRMFNEVIRSFNMVFKKFHWHQYRQWFRVQLNGTTGKVTTDDLQNIRDFEDFIGVYRDTEREPLPIMPKDVNPYMSSVATGARARFWTALPAVDVDYTKKRLLIRPVTSVGYLNVHARVHPHPDGLWDWTDPVELDRDMLVYGTAFMTLVNSELNSGAANTCKGMMEMRFRDIMNNLASHGIPISTDAEIPLTWREVP